MKLYISLTLTALLAVLAITGVSSQPSKYEGKIVRKIDFVGLKSVSPEDLLYIMRTSAGYPLKSAEVRKDIKDIFDKGKFEKVDVEIEEFQDGVQLRFICKERPRIASIEFRGLDEFVETDLKETILLKEGEVYRKDYLEKSVALLKEKYDGEGLFNAHITYKVLPVKDEDDVNVQIIIDEGEQIKVQKISILGTDKLYSEEVQDLMETKEEGLIRDGAFKKEIYDQDKAKIVGFYREKGYLDAQILEDSVDYEWEDPEKKETRVIYIVIKISEGEKYYFDKSTVTISGEKEKTIFTPEEISKDFELKENGEVFNDTKFQMDRQMISFKYASKGYIFARVIPKRSITEKEVDVEGKKEKRKYVTIDYVVTEGTQAYVESIIIKGNKKTKEKVIRRELVIKEGELFNSAKMQVSREKVYNLGYFKQVDFDVRPGSREGYMNLVVDVEEQPSGTISLGGGYGTQSGFSIFSDITENNFLGNGQRVGVKFEYGPRRSSITLSFTEPWLMDYPVAFSTSIFYYLYTIETSSMFSNTNQTAEYQKQAFGYSLGLSYRFMYYYVIGTNWSHAFKSYLNPTGNASDEIFIAAADRIQEKRSQSFYAFRDSKDNYLNPTSGSRVGMSIELTGGAIYGGQDHYVRFDPELYLYYSPFHLPFLKSHPCVFEFRANGSFIVRPLGNPHQNYETNQWLEAEDRLTIGGPETLRGWDYYDFAFPDSWAYNGLYHRILYGVEFRVPIHPQMLWLVLFFDAGSLWTDTFWEKQLTEGSDAQTTIQTDKDNGDLYAINQIFSSRVNLLQYFKYSYGFGFRIQIPMMPLRFWFGKKFIYDGSSFRNVGDLTFQFQIGDMRF
ncbi:MAG: outer membrane protein assembly factor BamA [Spirochaetae bacterium HGW-Spirochaetae-1]|jgi:outer membrane protein insertion porin family|nr:MAG: outer membrane protein assembly factor BamA [Spirochaetae bacterium HGW-Spirochaetae-1]